MASQDAEHYLLECPLFNSERQDMLEFITEAVLGDSDCPKDIKIEVRNAVLKFLTDTSQDINI